MKRLAPLVLFLIVYSVYVSADTIEVLDAIGETEAITEVTVDLSNETIPVGTFSFTLDFNTGHLYLFDSCQPGDVFPGTGWDEFQCDTSIEGQITVSGTNYSAAIPAGSSGTLARIYYYWQDGNSWCSDIAVSYLGDDLADFDFTNGEFVRWV